MSGKCFVISSCICFIVISSISSVFCLPWFIGLRGNPYGSRKALTRGVAFLFIESEQVVMSLSSIFSNELKSPTVESFIRETTKSNSLRGLPVYLNLTDACQALDEVSKIRTQVPKIALVTLVNESTPGGGVLPYMDFIGMCRCEGSGFQAVYSRIGYINQSV